MVKWRKNDGKITITTTKNTLENDDDDDDKTSSKYYNEISNEESWSIITPYLVGQTIARDIIHISTSTELSFAVSQKNGDTKK